jgi:hypothetical protein
MAEWSEIRDMIIDKAGVPLRPASEEAIVQLQTLTVPDDALSFFREAEPADHAEIDKVRLLPIATVIDENTNYVPGCYTWLHGYVVFATTLYGDTDCFDLNNAASRATAPIVLLSHEMVGEKTTRDELGKLAKRIAPNFGDFLRAYVTGNLDIKPNYE